MDSVALSPAAATIQAVSAVLAVAIIVIEVLWALRNRFRWLYGVPVVMLMVHLLFYYVSLYLYRNGYAKVPNPITLFTDWSALLRWHSLVTWVMLEGTRLLNSWRKHGK